MKKEGTFGTAAFLTVAAAVGISLQFASKPNTGQGERVAPLRRTSQTPQKANGPELGPGCRSIQQQLQDFFNVGGAIAPRDCYAGNVADIAKDITDQTSKLKFVIATLPDPLHTHQAVLFDQFTAAIQDAAQDEQYDFDSSWLPWDDDPNSYPLLDDQQTADTQKELREQQPGIILFRRAARPEKDKQGPASPDNDKQGLVSPDKDNLGLVVFVVGEEATHGIHNGQFQNALTWVKALVPDETERRKRLAILGPTFSGSLHSLTQLLWDNPKLKADWPLDVFSGSVSSEKSAEEFKYDHSKDAPPGDDGPVVVFRSFIQSDEQMLNRFCSYMKWDTTDYESFAILSEDETAYGERGADEEIKGTKKRVGKTPDSTPKQEKTCTDPGLKLFYPRDISALRGAYQTKSIFDVQGGSQPPDSQRSLPTDLADPAGKVHDSIRSYGGNQTPLAQEAFLLEIVAALRDLNARYILVRGSNALDQLFLANFLRRMYPNGRIVILTSDLMYIRERGATGLNGAMTLTNYPLFPLARDWTEHAVNPAADRAFSSDTSEGTYIAFRVLLNSRSLNGGKADQSRCYLKDEDADAEGIFVPEILCTDFPVPDYAPPYWMVPDNCTDAQAKNPGCNYPGPATWLTVIGVNRFWPIASLTSEPQASAASCASQGASTEPGRMLHTPPGMKLFFAALIAFALFHAWCCWRGSYTAKPNFLAHFASAGDGRHAVLVLIGSSLIAFIGIVAAWGCGAFCRAAYSYAQPGFALTCAVIVCVIALLSIVGRIVTVWRLRAERHSVPASRIQFQIRRASLIFLGVLAFFGLHVLVWELNLRNSDGALTFWRSMNLTSGISPIVPQIALLAGLYCWFWLALHGLALFGADRPRLPSLKDLKIKVEQGTEDLLPMFSQEVAAQNIENAGRVLAKQMRVITVLLFVLLLGSALVFGGLHGWIFFRGLGPRRNVIILMLWLLACISLQLAEAWRLIELWRELRGLLEFLDRLPLRRTLAGMRGISWTNVWKMGGNVLEVRYEVISRQLESMNHSIASLEEFEKTSQNAAEKQAVQYCLERLKALRAAAGRFADWYASAYRDRDAGDLTMFKTLQESIAKASGALVTHLLIPAWRTETKSLILAPTGDKETGDKETPPQAKDEHVHNAEEFVCLTYLGFIQNILGRLRTLAMTIMSLFFATTISLSTYPFDPRRVLSAILVALFVAVGIVVVKVYAEMHRDVTLSHVTNTKPGALDPEFWFKVIGFGFAPVVGLLARNFPEISDFIFSWIQPNVSSLK